mmetsp:Transcript_25873/g.72461  ORF Transcript_25873/g.72461 Transcript_25873/m.72461 type:complete len:128 (-) Transcript_25873:2720-3103(-)
MSDLQAALKEVERVSKKQRTCTDTTVKCVDELLEALRSTKSQLQADSSNSDAQLALKSLVNGLNVHTKVASAQKDLYSSVSKLGKVSGGDRAAPPAPPPLPCIAPDPAQNRLLFRVCPLSLYFFLHA